MAAQDRERAPGVRVPDARRPVAGARDHMLAVRTEACSRHRLRVTGELQQLRGLSPLPDDGRAVRAESGVKHGIAMSCQSVDQGARLGIPDARRAVLRSRQYSRSVQAYAQSIDRTGVAFENDERRETIGIPDSYGGIFGTG